MSYAYLKCGNHDGNVNRTIKYFVTYFDSNGSGYMAPLN